MTLSPGECQRLHVLMLLESSKATAAKAAEALGITPRHLRRLRAKLRRWGPTALVHRNRGRPSPHALPAAVRAQVVALARGRYAGLNDVHLTEKLSAVEGLVLSRATVQRLLRAAGLRSPRRRRAPRHRGRRPRRPATHGGSLRCFVQRRGAGRPLSSSVQNLINLEAKLGLHTPEAFRAFSQKIERLGNELGALLRDLKAKGKKVAGYGAPAKATTLLYQFNLANVLDFIVDDSPLKQNLYTPGYHIPVLSSRAIAERKPDYLLLLAWNFADSIVNNNKAFLSQGGHIVVPLPELRVV